MKKLYSLLVLTLCLLWGVSASAQTVTFDFVANEWEHALGSGNGETAAAGNMEDPIVARSNNDGVELSFGKGSASQPPRYWTGPQLRVYNGNTITLKPLDASKAIVRVAFTAASGYFKFTTTTGTLDELTWTGNQNEVTFTGTGSSRLTSIEVTLADATDDTEVAGTTVQMPNITPRTNTNRTDSVIVTITGDEETSIYYTLDGTDPTDASTLYTAPFALYESATVKAIAYNATGASSAIAEVAYTITPSETTEPADPTDSQTSSYTFERTNTIESGKQYLLVAPVDGVYKVATLITRNYGYYNVTDVAAREDGTIVLDNLDNAFTIEATNEANVYTIKQSDGRYVYQTGSYNSFNLSADLVDGSNWLISASNDNNLTIRNVSVQKWIQYSTGYKSFGSYAEAVDGGVAAELWVLTQSQVVEPGDEPTDPTEPTDSTEYTIVTFPFSQNPWGLETGSTDNSQAGGITEPIEESGVVFSADNGGGSTVVRMWTTNGNVTMRTYKGTSINFEATDESQAIYKIVIDGNGMNYTAEVGAIDTQNKTWTGNATSVNLVATATTQVKTVTVYLGERTDETVQPGIYVAAPVISPASGERSDSVQVTIKAGENAYIYYTIDGTEPTWDATRYFEPFKLYESATVKAIAYDDEGNASAVSEATYTITVTEPEPVDTTDTQTSSYTFERTNTIESGKQYLLVAPVDGVYKVATLITRNYGYYYVTDVAAREDGTIVLDNLDNAFTIEATNEANVYTIKQSDGRYVYQTGDYNSFNLSADLVDGTNWLISASNDNNLTIRNVSVQKWIQYSTGYKSFGSYAEEVDGSVAAELWVLTQSEIVEPVDDPNVLFEEPATSTNNQLVIEDVALADGLSKVWSFSNTYGATASAYASGTNYDSESWLHLPVIDLPADAPARLTFEHSISRFFVDVNNEATLWIREVEVAPTQLATVDASWTQLNINYPTIVEGKNFSSFEIQELSLADFAGKSVEIAFRYVSTSEGAGTWEIRNIKVDTEPLTGISEILLPTTAQPAIYDLQGRRVTQPLTRGVYIVGGRKVYVK